MSRPVSRLVCAGCGAEPGREEPYPFRCRKAAPGDDVDHVLRRELDLDRVAFPLDDPEPNPFVRYRRLLHAYDVATRRGFGDGEFCTLVRELDREIARFDGDGFTVTPFHRSNELSEALGFSDRGGVWVKDETGNVSGSHKARHLFNVLLYLEVAERTGLADRSRRPELAIASCGNAALAAAIVAAAGRRALEAFVPVAADLAVVDRLKTLGARVTVCARTGGTAGDPTYERLLAAVADGALPFTCQGTLNGLAVEGGVTLAYELASAGVTLDRLVVQVGGGALASACSQGLREAAALGALPVLPRLDTVQTAAAWPLKRAYDAIVAGGDGYSRLRYAARNRSSFMWAWEEEPQSIAHGILDDETYDWLAVVEGMLETGGHPLVAGEETLVRANELARELTSIDVDPTGSAGLAGLLHLRESGDVGDDERVAVLFTGVTRTSTERSRDEKFSRPGHPLAEGIRAI